MPLTTSKLRRLVKSKHPYVERNLSAVVTIIRHAVQNASSFEAVAEQLKDGRIQDKGENKLEQIKSSVNLPFFSFLQRNQLSNLPSKQTPQESNRVLDTQLSAECSAEPATSLDSEDIILLDGDRQSNQAPEEPVPENQPSSSSKLDDIILLDSDSDDEAPQADESAGTENQANTKDNQETSTPELVVLDEDDDVEEDENDNGEPMSLSDLSSNFQKCLQSSNEAAKQDGNFKQTGLLQFKPFDYEAARKELRFGENARRGARTGDNSGGGKNMGKKKGDKSNQEEAGLPQGRRRQAFPASGNRSATFR